MSKSIRYSFILVTELLSGPARDRWNWAIWTLWYTYYQLKNVPLRIANDILIWWICNWQTDRRCMLKLWNTIKSFVKSEMSNILVWNENEKFYYFKWNLPSNLKGFNEPAETWAMTLFQLSSNVIAHTATNYRE